MAMQQLEAHEMPLHKIFCSDFDFIIPDYQRPYAWEVEQARQLLDDLVEALGRNEDEPYFLGSIVLVKEKGNARAEVIDGQQRLTTLTIVLAVLRDLTDDPALSADLEKMITEPGNRIRRLEPKPRLTLRAQDAGFFAEHVQSANGVATLLSTVKDALRTDAQRAVLANTAVIHEALAEWPEDRRLDLIGMLSERTYLVVVATPDLASAHRIFSVMNSRGLDLSPADIFKSTVIGAILGDASTAYAKKWEDAEESLGREAFADLFLHVRLIFARERARRELLKEFDEQVLDKFLPDRPTAFIDDVLTPYADAYQQVLRRSYASSTGADKVNRWLTRLDQLETKDWMPPAIWALRHHAHDAAWLDAFLKRLERLAASLLIRREYASPRAQRYADLLRELSEGRGLDAPAFELSPNERAETVRRLDGDLYQVTRVRKYVLLRLDETLANNAGVAYDHRIITVEHVLPQQPGIRSEWRQVFTDDDRATWTHRVANLVLLNRAKNSEAQNYDFATKKERYFAGRLGVSTFALTSQVLAQQAWTPDVLEARQRRLMGVLRQEWSL